MAITSYPFEGQATSEAQYSRLFRELQATGIAASADSDAFLVSVDAGGVRVRSGFAIVRGHAVHSTADEVLPVSAPPFSATRIDRVVLRLDPAANSIVLAVKEGVAGAGAPALTQTDTGVYEEPIATLTVTDGSPMQVTDERTFVGLDAGAWTTARRPASPRLGQLGYNTQRGKWEFWNGSTWADVGGTGSHGTLTGLSNDDHPQYMLVVRHTGSSWPARSTVTSSTQRTVVFIGPSPGPSDAQPNDFWWQT